MEDPIEAMVKRLEEKNARREREVKEQTEFALRKLLWRGHRNDTGDGDHRQSPVASSDRPPEMKEGARLPSAWTPWR